MSWGPSSGNSPEASPVRVRSGEPLDALIMVNTGMDDLVATGHFKALERKDVAVSRIGVAVKAGHAVSDVGEATADGEVELGIQQFSELRLEPGLTVVGPLPDEDQRDSVVSAAVSSKARDVDAAKRFLAFLSTPFARAAIRASGLDLPSGTP